MTNRRRLPCAVPRLAARFGGLGEIALGPVFRKLAVLRHDGSPVLLPHFARVACGNAQGRALVLSWRTMERCGPAVDPLSRSQAQGIPMAPRTFWKGYLKLSFVTCAVAMTPAVSDNEKVRFHTLNRKTGNRIESRYVDAVSGEVVESARTRSRATRRATTPTSSWRTRSSMPSSSKARGRSISTCSCRAIPSSGSGTTSRII